MKHIVSLFALAFITSFSFGQDAEKASPVFKDGLAQPVDAFSEKDDWIVEELWVESEFDSDEDGSLDRMYVYVVRPQQTKTEDLKVPVIYISSPYFAGVAPDAEGSFWSVEHELGDIGPERVHPPVRTIPESMMVSRYPYQNMFVPLGYAVIYSSSPGTGQSQGAPTIGGINESLAPKAVVDWLNGRAKGFTSQTGDEATTANWSTGKVGMIGTSFNGTLALAAATTGVEGLEVIVPVAPNTSSYHYYRSNGLVRSPGGYLGEDIDVLYDFVHSGAEDKREGNNQRVRVDILEKHMDRQTGDWNEFWAGRDYLLQMDNMKAAMLMSHGFNDWNVMPEHSHRIYKKAQEMGLTTQIYYHQAGHGGMPPFEMLNKWFSQFLYGQDNGIENETDKAWIVREHVAKNEPTAYADYPNPEAKMVTLYPTKGGNKAGGLTTTKKKKQKKESLTDDATIKASELAKAENSTHRLLYTTPVLAEDLHISGLAEIEISLASSKPAANLSVYLVSLPWEDGKDVKIYENIVTRGWADPQNHSSLTDGEPLEKGKFYNLSFTLQPDDHIIPAGQQLGLMIFSSDKNFTLHPAAGTELTIDLDKTKLHLPVVGGDVSFE